VAAVVQVSTLLKQDFQAAQVAAVAGQVEQLVSRAVLELQTKVMPVVQVRKVLNTQQPAAVVLELLVQVRQILFQAMAVMVLQ
jgi:hypothetical protein